MNKDARDDAWSHRSRFTAVIPDCTSCTNRVKSENCNSKLTRHLLSSILYANAIAFHLNTNNIYIVQVIVVLTLDYLHATYHVVSRQSLSGSNLGMLHSLVMNCFNIIFSTYLHCIPRISIRYFANHNKILL